MNMTTANRKRRATLALGVQLALVLRLRLLAPWRLLSAHLGIEVNVAEHAAAPTLTVLGVSAGGPLK